MTDSFSLSLLVKFPWNRDEMSLGVWLTLVEGWCAVDVSWDERGFRLFSYCVIPHSSNSTLLDEQTAMKHWLLSLGGKKLHVTSFFFFLICCGPKKYVNTFGHYSRTYMFQWYSCIYSITKYQSGKRHLQTNDSFSQN